MPWPTRPGPACDGPPQVHPEAPGGHGRHHPASDGDHLLPPEAEWYQPRPRLPGPQRIESRRGQGVRHPRVQQAGPRPVLPLRRGAGAREPRALVAHAPGGLDGPRHLPAGHHRADGRGPRDRHRARSRTGAGVGGTLARREHLACPHDRGSLHPGLPPRARSASSSSTATSTSCRPAGTPVSPTRRRARRA